MANITEHPVWEDGIYQIERRDPLTGGPEGSCNIQAKQLANRTLFLKEKQEEAQAAIDALEDVHPSSVHAILASLGYALNMSRYNRQRLDGLSLQGEVTISNMGVISGCGVSKSQTATRNLSLAGGVVFYGARIVPVNDQENIAVIPSNNSDSDKSSYCYLTEENGLMVMKCTLLGQEAPENCLVLYRVNVPAGNTAETDSGSANIALTDLRRKEPGYPTYYSSAAFAQIAFDKPFMKTSDYDIQLDVVSYKGGGFQQGMIYVGDRAVNGFKIYTNGTIDEMKIRWRATRRSA
ncbi:MAG: hypothetical protein ILP16_03015 [Spirochaetales bacterium]|nr:hypothetical protein [Spirochaetales bacterium]